MPLQRLATGIDLYYETHGAGEAFVLCPSTGFAADVWHPYQVPELAKSLQLVIFDPRGVGRTTHYQGIYTIDQMGCDVIALLDHLEIDRFHVLGHSMGGRIALWLALSFPGRVKSLVMAASGSGAAARQDDAVLGGMPYSSVKSLMGQTFEGHNRHSLLESDNYFTSDFRAQHPDRVQAMYEVITEHHADWPEFLRHTMARYHWEATHRLGEVTVPTLVLIGDRDTSGANHYEQAQVLRQRIPNAAYRELKGVSHGFFWQVPDETNAILLDWVARHSG